MNAAARKEGRSKRPSPETQSSGEPDIMNTLVTALKLKSLRPISREDIPINRGHGKGTVRSLPPLLEMDKSLAYITKKSINPHEIRFELDMSGPEVEAERVKRKSFPQTFRKTGRAIIKEHGLEKLLEFREIDRGARYLLVGRAL